MPVRRAAQLAVAIAATCASVTWLAAPAADAAAVSPAVGAPHLYVPQASASVSAQAAAPGSPGNPGTPRQLFVPDLIAAAPGGITSAELAKIRKLGGVQAVLPVDGGKIMVNGRSADVLGVPPQAFRAWTPLSTAASASVWSDLSQGKLISTAAAARRLRLAAGTSYRVSGAVTEHVLFGGPAALSVPGADAIMNLARSAQLGLAKNFAVLISAPAANLSALKAQVRAVVGHRAQVVNLVSYTLVTAGQQPVATYVPAGAPANYLTLFKQSAAQYCPGLPWTVLAAIGEIESGDGANDGPSSAGALGPMQFMPSTWALWGITGFGPPGRPDILNPLDAVPSAARMLCADGGGDSATLAAAIFDYNHATWYVTEVLALAGEYAKASS